MENPSFAISFDIKETDFKKGFYGKKIALFT